MNHCHLVAGQLKKTLRNKNKNEVATHLQYVRFNTLFIKVICLWDYQCFCKVSATQQSYNNNALFLS